MKFFSKNKDSDFLIEEKENNTIYTGGQSLKPSHKLTPDEVVNFGKEPLQRYDGKSALESLKKRMQNFTDENTVPSPESKHSKTENVITDSPKENLPKKDSKSLLEKCKPFITENDKSDFENVSAPLYKLESVADILKNDSQKAIDRLAEKYDIKVDYLGKFVEEKTTQSHKETDNRFQKDENHDNKIKINAVFENVQSSVPFELSEIKTEISEKTDENIISDTSTITFTPISDENGTIRKSIVTGNTQNIDLTNEFSALNNTSDIGRKIENTTLEKDEFEDFNVEEEIHDLSDAKKYIRKFSVAKRKSFLSLSFSVIFTLILAFMKLPFMSGLILSKTKPLMIVFTAIALIVTLFNADIFASFTKIFKKSGSPDICLSLATLSIFAYAVLGIVSGEIILDLLLLLCILLSVRALGKFKKDSYMLSNLKQISVSGTKKALKLIDDPAVTFAMAKNSIDGDVLIAAPQKCNNVNDFIKYSAFGTFLNGKLPTVTALSLILSLLAAIAAANYYDGIFYGIYAAAAIQCFSALPSLFFIKDFPLYSAAKKLNKSGAMISGQTAASHIEIANATVFNSADIFPSGTVTLHQMKVLSENSLDETILRAASLTDCLNSPLAPIFKKIAGESNIATFPDSDTIKYEERMGISGWVDDQLLFIGNRTLMEAHGIAVPDIEIDRKILRKGYFPVYVASADKVCALLVVQYSVNPDIAKELHRLSKIGITVLINNTDPNITNEMICDYLGLYEDSVMIITNAGYHMYKNAITPKDSCSAPAAFRGSPITIAKIINCANKIRRSNILLTVLYIISAVIGIMIFAYSSFGGSGALIGSSTVLLYSLICTLLSYILYLFEKP